MTAATTDPSSGRGLDTSIGKALALLDAFTADLPSLGVSEVARRAGLPKSTAFRLLASLEAHGYVERHGTGYRLGRRLFELGNHIALCRPRGLRDVALPYLSELYERTHHVVNLAVLDGSDVLYLEKLVGHRHVRTPSHVGGRVPAACCGLGKALLAFSDDATVERVVAAGLPRLTPYSIAQGDLLRSELELVAHAGVAYDREEAAVGLTCVAAPIIKGGRAVAALSISGSTGSFEPTELAPVVRRAAVAVADAFHP